MRESLFTILALVAVLLTACAQNNSKDLADLPPIIQNAENYNTLDDRETYVIVHKGTERPFTGKYNAYKKKGTYICKRCNAPLFKSKDKFNSGTGWPSFDDTIEGAVKELTDADGRRTEIVCDNCDAHLGHVFRGEGFTNKQTRHCVNSISLNFVPKGDR